MLQAPQSQPRRLARKGIIATPKRDLPPLRPFPAAKTDSDLHPQHRAPASQPHAISQRRINYCQTNYTSQRANEICHEHNTGNDSLPFQQFQVLFNSLFKVLFIFPSRYLFAIGLAPIFSFRWNLPPTLRCIPKQRDSKNTGRTCNYSGKHGSITLNAGLFQGT